jgi:hypothetical protein
LGTIFLFQWLCFPLAEVHNYDSLSLNQWGTCVLEDWERGHMQLSRALWTLPFHNNASMIQPLPLSHRSPLSLVWQLGTDQLSLAPKLQASSPGLCASARKLEDSSCTSANLLNLSSSLHCDKIPTHSQDQVREVRSRVNIRTKSVVHFKIPFEVIYGHIYSVDLRRQWNMLGGPERQQPSPGCRHICKIMTSKTWQPGPGNRSSPSQYPWILTFLLISFSML